MDRESYAETLGKFDLLLKINNKMIELEAKFKEALKQQPVQSKPWYHFSTVKKSNNLTSELSKEKRIELSKEAMKIILDEEVAKLSNEFEKDDDIRQRLQQQYYDEYYLRMHGVLPEAPSVKKEEPTGSPNNFNGNWRRGGYRRRKNKTRSKKAKRSKKTHRRN